MIASDLNDGQYFKTQNTKDAIKLKEPNSEEGYIPFIDLNNSPCISYLDPNTEVWA